MHWQASGSGPCTRCNRLRKRVSLYTGSLETPFFNSLQDSPDFQAILQQVRENQAAMRKKVLALDNLLLAWQP